MADVNPSSWATVIQTIIGGGIGTAAVQAVLPLIRERWQRNAHAAYMAMRLAVMLEAYADACANLISDNSELQPTHDEQYPAWSTALPTAPVYPDDPEGWRALDRKFACDCSSFRNNLRGSQGVISFYYDKVPDDLDTVTLEHAAKRGLEA